MGELEDVLERLDSSRSSCKSRDRFDLPGPLKGDDELCALSEIDYLRLFFAEPCV